MSSLASYQMHRRSFLRMLGGAAAYSALPQPVRATGNGLITISVLHTTDLHSHILPTSTYEGVRDVGGLARCATQIHLWKRLNPHHLLIDAGDVYQGTQMGYATQSRIMMDCFNHMNYDAWILGNHEFDWGMDAVNSALSRSAMPALCANSLVQGKPAGTFDEANHPLSNVKAYVLKDVAGFKIGVVGVTTPGMPFWFNEALYRGFEFLDPIGPVRNAIHELRALGADAIVLAGHMGLRRGGDDFANRTEALTKEFPEVVAFIGGHTHRDTPYETINGIPFTQSSYHGIHMGRLDITFDQETRRMKWAQPMTSQMDNRFAIDPAILAIAQDELDAAEEVIATPVGRLGQTLSIDNDVARPSQVEELIAAAMREALLKRGVETDAVIHGLIFPDGDFMAGDKTIGDLWKVMPYENNIVTARLNKEELKTILHEVYTNWNKRNVMGFAVETTGRGRNIDIEEIYDASGVPLHARNRYTIVFNSYDAQSAGHRYLQLREILRQPNSRMTTHPLRTRDALIDYFTAREVVTAIPSVELPRATQAA